MKHIDISNEINKIISDSNKIATKLKNKYIEPEHLFWALIVGNYNLTTKYLIASRQNPQITSLNALRRFIEDSIKHTYESYKKNATSQEHILSKDSENIIENAVTQASIFNDSEVTSIHLLLSILSFENKFTTSLMLNNITYVECIKFYKYSKQNYEEFEESIQIPPYNHITNSKPISLYFDLDEFSKDEIVEIIAYLSDVYNDISGDELEIVGTQRLEFSRCLEPVYA